MSTSLLVSWLVSAMLAWTPVQGASAERAEYLTGVAHAIVDVTWSDPPAFRGAQARSHTALLIASVGALETRFLPRIQEGRCKSHECDRGRAACFMQIQTFDGIELHEDARELSRVASSGAYSAADLADPHVCFHVALHMLRRALRWSGGKNIRAYTGETGADAPKSDERMGAAREWLTMHPVPPIDEDDVGRELGSIGRE